MTTNSGDDGAWASVLSPEMLVHLAHARVYGHIPPGVWPVPAAVAQDMLTTAISWDETARKALERAQREAEKALAFLRWARSVQLFLSLQMRSVAGVPVVTLPVLQLVTQPWASVLYDVQKLPTIQAAYQAYDAREDSASEGQPWYAYVLPAALLHVRLMETNPLWQMGAGLHFRPLEAETLHAQSWLRLALVGWDGADWRVAGLTQEAFEDRLVPYPGWVSPGLAHEKVTWDVAERWVFGGVRAECARMLEIPDDGPRLQRW